MVAHSYMLLPIVEVTDGDTIKSDMSTRLPDPLGKVSIRIRGIDTPEMPVVAYINGGEFRPGARKAQCIKEADLALEAKAFVEMIVIGYKKMKVDNFTWDKYGGRIVGEVKIGGVDVGTALIGAGVAVPYDGGTKTKDWC